MHRVTFVAETLRAVEAVMRSDGGRRRRRFVRLTHIARARLRHAGTGDPVDRHQLQDERVPRQVRQRPAVFLAAHRTARLDDDG